MRTSHTATLMLSAILLGGCVGNGGAVASNSPDNLSPEEKRMQSLESRQLQMQRRLDALNTARFDDDNLRLRDEMRALRGEVEKLRFDQQAQDKRSKELYQELDRRLQAQESRTASTAPTASVNPPVTLSATPTLSAPAGLPMAPVGAAPVAAGAPPVAVISQGVGTPEEEAAYLSSFDLLKNGKYDDAIKGFQGVLAKWPNGRYADNAAYWMGEANYVKKDFSGAQAAFQTVVSSYPASPKSADAMLKLGLTQVELKQVDQAKQTLTMVIQKYPTSNAAKLAQQKLLAISAGSAAPAATPVQTAPAKPVAPKPAAAPKKP